MNSRRWWWLPLLLSVACASSGQTPPATPKLPPQRLQRERSELEQRLEKAPAADSALRRDFGWALLVDGNWSRAAEVLGQAVASERRELRSLLGLALIAQELGQHRKVQDLWLQILEAVADGESRRDSWANAIAEVAAHRLLVLGGDGSGAAAETRLRERVLNLWQRSSALPLEAQQLLAALGGQLLRLAGAERQAEKLDVERGCPAAFYISGPVGHLPSLDLLTRFATDDPSRDPERPHYQRKSGYGCNVTLDGSGGRPGVMFAVAWARATKPGPQPLTIESGGAPWALLVDGRLSYQEQDPLRRRHLWLELQPGWHSLVLKVGTAGRVQVQLSAPGLSFFDGASAAAPSTFTGKLAPARRRHLAELPPARAGREEVLRALLHGQQAHIVGDAESGLDAVESVSDSAPRFTALTLLRAALLLEDRSRPERLLRDQTRGLLEQAVKDEPRLLRARLSLATLQLQEEHAEQAQELLAAAPPPLEPNWQLPLLTYRVLKARGWQVEAEKALGQAAASGPSACAILEAEVDLRRELHDVRTALAAAKQLTACNPYSARLGEVLVAADRLSEAQREYERLLLLEPESEEWQGELADVLVAGREAAGLARAEGLRRTLCARAPRNVSYRLALGNLLVERGEREAARKLLHDGQRLIPESLELSRALLALGEPGPMDRFRIDGRQVVSDFLAHNPGTFEGEPAVLLLDRTVVRVLPTAARLSLTHNIIRVLTKDGLGKFGEVKIPEGADVLTLRTIKADGTTREPEEIPEKDSVSAPDLEVGDFVEFEYLEHEAPLAAFPRAFLAERFYFASTDAPLDRSEYVLAVPADLPLQIDVRGPQRNGKRDVPQATEQRQGGERVYTWQAHQAPRIRPEPPLSEAVIEDWIPSVRVGAGLSFADYANYLRDRRVRTLHLGREVRALAAQVATVPGSTTEDAQASERALTGELGDLREPLDKLLVRARLLDAWVRRNIREGGSIDEQATSVLARRQGRRDVLLMALLRAAGIPCELWLVRPLTSPLLDGPLPDFGAYSDVVVAVAPGRGPGGQPALFLDPSFRHLPSGYVRPMLRGARALRLPEPQSSPPLPTVGFAEVKLPAEGGAPAAWQHGLPAELLALATTALRDSRHLEMTMTLAANGSGEVAVRETLTGGPALEWREHVENLSDEKLRQELEQRALGFYFPGASLLDLHYAPMDRDEEPLVIEYRFRAPQLARRRADSGKSELVLPAPYPVLLGRHYVNVAHRQTPLLLHYMLPTTVDAQIQLPAGAKVVSLTPEQALRDFGRFDQRVTVQPALATANGERLLLHAEVALPLHFVSPERYPQFVDFARRVDSAEESIAVLAIEP